MRKHLIINTLLAVYALTAANGQAFSYSVYTDSVIHKMRGGIGASWHVINNIRPLENQKYIFPVREDSPLGSAWAGTPPPAKTEAWKDLCNHARWLGLDFIRVELTAKSYEPNKHEFTWNSEDMQALYKVLDYCQQNDVDVFLQQMCLNTEWNAYPGVHPILSAPRSLDDFADGIATLVDYLVKTKNYTCIKYFCITNEPPGGTWGYWWSMGKNDAPFTPAVKRVHEEFLKRKISVLLSGPDWTDLPPFNLNKLDFSPWLGAYDIHSYGGIDTNGAKTVKQWADWAHTMNKPFFITEFGNMKLGWGGDNPGPKSSAAALSNAHDIITSLNLGTDAMNRWSFTNRGDMDGQWQLVRTFDIRKKEYFDKVVPENKAYYGFAMFTRFIAKYASVLKSVNKSLPDTSISFISLKNPDGTLVFILLNQSNDSKNGELKIDIKIKINKLYKYVYDEDIPSDGKFALNPVEVQTAPSGLSLILKGRSITVLSTKMLRDSDWGTIR
jgi:hypothetical protein